MSIKPDVWIKEMAQSEGMIEPFSENQVRVDDKGEKLISYGVSSFGYDVRCANEFKVFTNIHSATVDPKVFDDNSFVDITADWCATCQFNKLNVLNSERVIQLFKDNKVTLVRADWTRPNPKINIFLEKYDRFGIPFNAFFSDNFPDGLLLSELLSEKEIVNVINKINNE